MRLNKPILIFDGDCGFCRRWIKRWCRITGNRVDYAPYQEVGPRFPAISLEEFKSSVILIDSDGKTYRAAEAALRSLAAARSYRWMLWLYYHLPGARWAAEIFYRFVAAHRVFFSKIS